MSAKKMRALSLMAALFLPLTLQTQQGSVTAVVIAVTDPSGAAITNAKIRIVPASDATSKMDGDAGTVTVPRMEVDAKGRRQVDLRAGGYALVVESPGFKTAVTHFDVPEGKQSQTVSIAMQIGSHGGPMVVAAPPRDTLAVSTYPYHHGETLSIAELKAMSHISVTVHNPHAHADETYSGVRLADILARFNAPLGDQLHGAALADYIVASGADGYQAVLSLGEIDPSFHPGEVIVADAMNGKPLDTHNGPFKLIVSEDNRPARSVRNLTTIELKSAP